MINHQPLPQLAVILLTALYVLNLGYAFDGSFQRLDSYPFFSRTLAGGETRDHLRHRVRRRRRPAA